MRTWHPNSGRASRQRTPWWASDTSPGIGTWPPPIRPTSEIVWCGARQGRVVTHAAGAVGKDTAATRLGERIALQVQVLLGGGHASVSDQHRGTPFQDAAHCLITRIGYSRCDTQFVRCRCRCVRDRGGFAFPFRCLVIAAGMSSCANSRQAVRMQQESKPCLHGRLI
jgi:hypothetical protein